MSRIEEVLEYQHPGVIRKLQEDEGMSKTEAEILFKDVLRFLILSARGGKKLLPSKRIDIAWHTFILFTEDYHNFCYKFFDRFLHHRPLSKEMIAKVTVGLNLLKIVQAEFENIPCIDNWTRPLAGSGTCCGGCESEPEREYTPEELEQMRIKKELQDKQYQLQRPVREAEQKLKASEENMKNLERDLRYWKIKIPEYIDFVKKAKKTLSKVKKKIVEARQNKKQAKANYNEARAIYQRKIKKIKKLP